MSADPSNDRMNTYRLPLSPEPHRHAVLSIRNDLRPDEWERLLLILDLFRPGLVDDVPNPELEATP